jgi:hypothetical protein
MITMSIVGDDRMNQDLEHLRLLSIFHYVVGGIAALFACFPLVHFTIGMFLLLSPDKIRPPNPNDAIVLRLVGTILVVVASAIIVSGWTLAVCLMVAGRNLARRRHYTFCLVMAAIACTFMPFGTVLGVFTILVLIRPSVRVLFEQRMPGAGDAPTSS